MRINNPRSLAGFTLDQSVNDANYKLATVGQVSNAYKNIYNKVITLLDGPGNVDNPEPSNGHGNGYAWLGVDGKIDPSLLPSLAITEVHVVSQVTIAATGAVDADVYQKLSLWAREQTVNGGEVFQRGDIIIVTNANPVNDETTENTTTPPSTPLDPLLVGTYIITSITGEGVYSEFSFAKMAYSAASIVTINGKAPETTDGAVTVTLADILQTGSYLDRADGEDDAQAATKLSNVVYRLAKIQEGDKCRFGFIDDTNGVENIVVPYARYDEVQEESRARIADVTSLSGAIDDLVVKVDTADQFLSGEIDTVNAKIGNSTIAPSADFNYPLVGQIKKLRNDVDYNASLLDQTRTDTNALVEQLNTAISQVHAGVNEKAVTIVEKTIDWSDAEYRIISGATDAGIVEAFDDPTISGIVEWTYTYTPNVEANTTSSFDNGEAKNSNKSDEKIIGIFDANGSQVIADIERVKIASTDVFQSKIKVTTYWNGETPTSMVGQQWHLIIAKTIVGIPCEVPTTIAVGGASSVNVAKTAGTDSI